MKKNLTHTMLQRASTIRNGKYSRHASNDSTLLKTPAKTLNLFRFYGNISTVLNLLLKSRLRPKIV